MKTSNVKSIREALEWFWGKRSMLDFCHNNLSDKTWEDWDKVYCFLREFADKVQSALSAPPRNCDRYPTLAAALEAWRDIDPREAGAFDMWLFAEAKPKREAETEGEPNER